MYEYKYVTIKAKGIPLEFKERREVIDSHAAEGWRYAGWMPVGHNTGYGGITQIDLIFEREVK